MIQEPPPLVLIIQTYLRNNISRERSRSVVEPHDRPRARESAQPLLEFTRYLCEHGLQCLDAHAREEGLERFAAFAVEGVVYR